MDKRTPLVTAKDCNLSVDDGFCREQVHNQVESRSAGEAIDGPEAQIYRRELIVGQLQDYLPIVSGSRMIGGYVKLFSRLLKQRQVELVEVSEAA